MSNLPVRIGEAKLPAPLFDQALSDGLGFAASSKSAATRRAYGADWRDFTTWCDQVGRPPMPGDADTAVATTIAYLGELAGRGLATSTIDRRVAAIAYFYRLLGHDPPSASEKVRAVLQGIRNTLGRRPKQKRALTVELLTRAVRKITPDLAGRRDKALLLVAFASALRRSELMALAVADLTFGHRGLVIAVRRSKTDQAGRGQPVAIPNGKLKVPEAMSDWLAAGRIADGPVFRGVDRGRVSDRQLSDRQFANIVKARCEAIGLNPAEFSGHSTRRGFATSAGDAEADITRIAAQMRHARLDTTRGYIEESDLFRHHAGKTFL